MTTVGIYSARELVRLNTPFDAAVSALMDELHISEEAAIVAMHAAHERADWGFDRLAHEAVRT